MSKLAKVEHEKCGEFQASTYVWIPDDMNENEFRLLASRARDSYLEAERTVKELGPPAPWASLFEYYGKFPDKTVREINADYEAKSVAYSEWRKKAEAAQRNFAEFLIEVSEGRIQPFWPHDMPTAMISWGHRHGQAWPKFSETKILDYNPFRPSNNDEDDEESA